MAPERGPRGGYRIGIDVGGTFTDLVLARPDRTIHLDKTATTPHDQSEGVMVGLERLARSEGKSLGELLTATERIVHGTTLATNALLERKGARVGLLTTEGHRDVIEMREGLKDDRYNLRMAPPIPLVPRARRRGVRERMRFDGTVMTPLHPGSLAQAVGALAQAGQQVFQLVRRLREELKVNTTCGASNVSFGLPNREGINAAFLPMAIAAGMTSAITNPMQPDLKRAVMAADVLMGHDPDCARWIVTNREPPADGETGRRRVNRRLVASAG